MKNCTKSFFFVLLGILFASNLAEQPAQARVTTTPTPAAQSKKLLLFGIKGVLLYPDISKVKGGGFGALFGWTPEVVEKELFEAIQQLYVNGLQNYNGTYYPMLIEAWLTNQMTNEAARGYSVRYIKDHCGFLKKMRVKAAAEIAFSPYDAANVLSVNHAIVSIAQSCKAKGHTIAVFSSWNKESFNALKQTHYSVFTQFDQAYISGTCGILACDGHFYDQFLKKYKAEDIYVIDCLQENLTAAHLKGINTIYCASVESLQFELKKQGIL